MGVCTPFPEASFSIWMPYWSTCNTYAPYTQTHRSASCRWLAVASRTSSRASGNGCEVCATVRRAYTTLGGTRRLEPGEKVVLTDRPPPRVESMSADEIDGLIQLADESGDGLISCGEFVELVAKHAVAD